MKKNGFIATSLLFSFFIIFLTMSLMILASYTHYFGLLGSINGSVLKDLNDNTIIRKTITLQNAISNGDISSNTDNWSLELNSKRVAEEKNYIQMLPNSVQPTSAVARFYQTIQPGRKIPTGSRKVYIRYTYQRGNKANCSVGKVIFRSDNVDYPLTDTYCGDGYEEKTVSQILTIPIGGGEQKLIFDAGTIYIPANNTDVTLVASQVSKIKFTEIMVLDATDVYLYVDTNDDIMRKHLDSYDFFKDSYKIERK